ncbi:hypothetical protein V7138_08910 [Bacillus sp. JJ1533]|uniref:hypothetical protein n=1 Tax=Bacillus sp. JJ1533 TaxID=3122959 RepID=UPI002FFEB9C1
MGKKKKNIEQNEFNYSLKMKLNSTVKKIVINIEVIPELNATQSEAVIENEEVEVSDDANKVKVNDFWTVADDMGSEITNAGDDGTPSQITGTIKYTSNGRETNGF